MLTEGEPVRLADVLEGLGVLGKLRLAREAALTLSVKHVRHFPSICDPLRLLNFNPSPPSSPESSALEHATKHARRGGWKPTKCISPELRALAVHGAIDLARQGYPFTVMVTYRPPDGLSDAEGKRWIALQHARVGQALERRGHAFIGLTVFEKRPGARLHAHALYHVAKGCMDVIVNAVDVFERNPRQGQKGDAPIHARPARADDVEYITKQRRWAGPNIERHRPRPLRYQKGDYIVGARISFTKYAKAIIWPKPQSRRLSSPTTKTWIFNADGQGLLFDLTGTPPPTRSPSSPILRPKLAPLPTPMLRLLFSALPNVDVIDAMKTLGPTHQSIAERLSISRAQVTNILNGQFGPSRVVVQRVLEFTKAA